MKRFLIVALVVGILTAAFATTALAAGPVNAPAAQGYGPGTAAQNQQGTVGTCLGTGSAMRRGAPAWAGQPDAVADLLGMEAADIQAERLAGKSLAEIASDKGVSEETLVATILEAKKATLDGLVADGTLTAEQADAIYSHMQTQVETMVNRTATGPAMGRGQGMQNTLGLRTGGMGARMGGGMGGRWTR